VKMVTGDHLKIAKETARRLGLGTNIYEADTIAHPESVFWVPLRSFSFCKTLGYEKSK